MNSIRSHLLGLGILSFAKEFAQLRVGGTAESGDQSGKVGGCFRRNSGLRLSNKKVEDLRDGGQAGTGSLLGVGAVKQETGLFLLVIFYVDAIKK